ncbi:serine/threonine-protein kinase [Paludisphaera sp.]|uniref:serine/threonine-protein kinase n=1 Tax=Paludisphaera sp. TaxID=2017432 RepID=UPI00301D1999
MALPVVPGYEVVRLIGQGGMGRVYLARHGRLGHMVCIKLLAAGAGPDPSVARERFEREARLLAAASHPHVLTVIDFGVLDDGSPYLVTEYVEHGDLRKLMAAGRIPPARRRSILGQIGAALAHIHAKGILHRDLKPENILAPTDSLVKVADFGLAVLEDDRGRLTRTSQGIGTLVYASPEQQGGGAVDARSDQYSLAAIAYELLTGKRPVGSFRRPSEVDPTLDRRVDAVVMKALSPSPADRYATLGAFLEDLDRALAPPTSARLGTALIGVGLMAAVAAVLTGLVLRPVPEPPPVPPPAPAPPTADEPLPPAEPSEAFRRLTEMRAHEIWLSQGSPEGEAGEAVSFSNWVEAENQVREAVKGRAFEIWKSQGSPTGAAGDALREPNMRLAEEQLLREALGATP